jgi:hypothetical protein
MNFFELRKDTGRMIEITLKDRRCIAAADGILILQLINQVEANIFESVRTDALEFLKMELKNRNLSFDIRVDEELKVENRPYTNSEKFKFLMEQNPVLLDMAKKFGLDPDF